MLQSASALEGPESVSISDTVHGAIRLGEGSKGSITRSKWRGLALTPAMVSPGLILRDT